MKPDEVSLQIVLIAPPAGVDFGLQKGKGSDFETIQKQRSSGGDLRFEAVVTVKDNRPDGLPNFLGPLAQGPTIGRFLYIDIGTLAGQKDTPWERRIKVPLAGITWEMIRRTDAVIEAQIPGVARDGGPSCGTCRPKGGWQCVSSDRSPSS